MFKKGKNLICDTPSTRPTSLCSPTHGICHHLTIDLTPLPHSNVLPHSPFPREATECRYSTVFAIAKQEQVSTSTWQLNIGDSHTSNHQVLRAQYIPPRITTDNYQYYSIYRQGATMSHSGYSSCQASGTLPFLLLAFCCAKITFLSTIPTFRYFRSKSYGKLSINNSLFLRYPNTCSRSTKSIQTTNACSHKWFPMSLSLHRCRCRYIDVARYSTSGEEKLGILRQLCGSLE